MKKNATGKDASPSRLIDARIKELGDWRGDTLDGKALQELIRAAAAQNSP